MPFNQTEQCDRQELSSAINTFVFHAPFYWYGAFYYFFDMWITGCRPIELLRPEALSLTADEVSIVTAKTGFVRTIPKAMLSINLIDALENGTRPYEGLTYDQLMNEFRRLFPLPKLYTEEKEVSMYVFRYNRAFELFRDGISVPDIQKYFAWENPDRASHYITRPLYFVKQSKL